MCLDGKLCATSCSTCQVKCNHGFLTLPNKLFYKTKPKSFIIINPKLPDFLRKKKIQTRHWNRSICFGVTFEATDKIKPQAYEQLNSSFNFQNKCKYNASGYRNGSVGFPPASVVAGGVMNRGRWLVEGEWEEPKVRLSGTC